MIGFYVVRGGSVYHYADTQQSAIDWATNAAPRNPPKGFRWEVWRNDGVRVAVLTYNRTSGAMAGLASVARPCAKGAL